MNEDMSKYSEAFLSEARALVKEMNLALIEWEKSPQEKKYLQDIFRMAHTLKSISAAMNYQQMAEVCHAIEDILDAIRNNKIKLQSTADTLFAAFDFFGNSFKILVEETKELQAEPLLSQMSDLIKHPHLQVKNPQQKFALESISTIEVKVERLDKLLNLAKELLVNKMRLESLSEAIQSSELAATVDIMTRTVSELQYHVMQIRLVPIGFVFDRFTRMVRDLAKQQQKTIELAMEGGEIELDRSLIDGISEALAHIIRNAIDHGFKADKLNKKPGEIKLSAKKEKEALVIEISDNGAGLDLEAIKKKAVQEKVVAKSADKNEVMQSIFAGISTTEKVTRISGRGLGLSIVKQKIESINGTVEVFSEEGKGTTFVIRIPITLAVIYVLLIKQAHHTYAIPLNSVERLINISQQEIKGLLNDKAIIYDHKSIPLINLGQVFSLPSHNPSERKSIVVVRKDHHLLGLVVDYLLTTEEIITQPLNSVIRASKFFSGTALLGSGEMILILDVDQLFFTGFELKKELEKG